ncbi:MAG: VWA domain-containing protein [Coriobacteriales bacterium]|nr:VWA domain-containing protein [Coriobacteriales bacterium]
MSTLNREALMLLVDVSGSMSGTPIDELNKGIARFKRDMLKDPKTASVLDVGIITFSDANKYIQPFAPVTAMADHTLRPEGSTEMNKAVKAALTEVDNQYRRYLSQGIRPYKPWVLLITDGYPNTPVDEAAEVVRQMEADGKLKLLAFGCGSYSSETLHKLAGEKVTRLTDYDFTKLFDWVHKSMRAVSESSPGDKVKTAVQPDNFEQDTCDWLND